MLIQPTLLDGRQLSHSLIEHGGDLARNRRLRRGKAFKRVATHRRRPVLPHERYCRIARRAIQIRLGMPHGLELAIPAEQIGKRRLERIVRISLVPQQHTEIVVHAHMVFIVPCGDQGVRPGIVICRA